MRLFAIGVPSCH